MSEFKQENVKLGAFIYSIALFTFWFRDQLRTNITPQQNKLSLKEIVICMHKFIYILRINALKFFFLSLALR
jgi:hypothetical protein